MSYLEDAKTLKEDYDWQITFEDYNKEECFKELLEKAKSLRTKIIGVSIMKNSKSKDDEDAVEILDKIIGDSDSQNTNKASEEQNA